MEKLKLQLLRCVVDWLYNKSTTNRTSGSSLSVSIKQVASVICTEQESFFMFMFVFASTYSACLANSLRTLKLILLNMSIQFLCLSGTIWSLRGRNVRQGRTQNWWRGCFYFPSLGSLPSPSPSLPFSSYPLPHSFPSRPLPLEVAPFKPARVSGERCKLPSGIRSGARRKRIWCTLELSESHR